MANRFLLAILLAGLVLPSLTPPRALACTGGFQGGYTESIWQMYKSEQVEAVTLAEITDVRLISPTGSRLGISPIIPLNGTVARFSPNVVWSNTPLSGNSIGPLGYTAPDCSGGPTFEVGDKVLLFLARPRYGVADYSIGVAGDTILFRGDQAYFMHGLPYRHMTPAGSTQDVLDYLLSIAGSPETTGGPAREFLGIGTSN